MLGGMFVGSSLQPDERRQANAGGIDTPNPNGSAAHRFREAIDPSAVRQTHSDTLDSATGMIQDGAVGPAHKQIRKKSDCQRRRDVYCIK